MATEIGWASLGIIPSFDGFDRKLTAGTSRGLLVAGQQGGTVFGDAAGTSAGKRFGSLFKSAAKASLVGIAGVGALAFKVGSDSIESASSLAESVNAVNVAYGKQGKFVQALGNSSAKLNGVSNKDFNEFAVRFSSFSKTIAGGNGFKVVKTLDDISDRATDFASVFNVEVAEAASLFQSGLAGETEPLRRFGIDLSAAKVEAFALSEGIVKNKDDLDESAKVQARYRLLMEQTSQTQGDFANTSDSLANRQRILSARWEDAKAKLGAGLLPIVEEFTGFLIDEGVPAVEKFSEWFNDEGIDGLRKFGNFTKDKVFPVVEDLAGFFKNAAGEAEDLIKWLKDLPDPAKYAGLVALLGGVAALKIRGGGGKLGAVGSALGLAKPVPVFVTNPGFGGGGLPGGGSKPGKVWIPGIGLLAVPAVGGSAAAIATADDNRNSLAPGSGGFAGDGGMTLPPGTRLDELDDLGELFGKTEAKADQFFTTSSDGFEDLISGGIRPTRDGVSGLHKDIDDLPTRKQLQIALSGADIVRDQIQAIFSLFDTRVISKEVQASDPMAPAPSGGRRPRSGRSSGDVNVNFYGATISDGGAYEKASATKGQQAALGGWG